MSANHSRNAACRRSWSFGCSVPTFLSTKLPCPVYTPLHVDGTLHRDPHVLLAALNNTWEWIDNEWTLVTIPNAGHWVHHDAAEQVTRAMVRWLRD